jgi:putative FmdB family regulatory protein
MPLLSWRCEDCGYTGEERVGIITGDTSAPPCLACGSDQTTRIMAAANLKRDGTYSYRSAA